MVHFYSRQGWLVGHPHSIRTSGLLLLAFFRWPRTTCFLRCSHSTQWLTRCPSQRCSRYDLNLVLLSLCMPVGRLPSDSALHRPLCVYAALQCIHYFWLLAGGMFATRVLVQSPGSGLLSPFSSSAHYWVCLFHDSFAFPHASYGYRRATLEVTASHVLPRCELYTLPSALFLLIVSECCRTRRKMFGRGDVP